MAEWVGAARVGSRIRLPRQAGWRCVYGNGRVCARAITAMSVKPAAFGTLPPPHSKRFYGQFRWPASGQAVSIGEMHEQSSGLGLAYVASPLGPDHLRAPAGQDST
eukprot:scaffold153567_cov39-Tisochrysis_lutea.AAC.1